MSPTNDALTSLREGCVHEVAIRSLTPGEIDLSDIQLADLIASEVGCTAIGASWKSIPSIEVEDYARRGFSFDLAYTTCRIDEDEQAGKLVALFFSQFSEERRSYVNVSDNPWTSNAYASTPTTNWTFDLSIVTMDSKKVGILCFTAED